MEPREVLKTAALAFLVDGLLALHPGLWKRAHRQERRALERPLWRTLTRAMVASGLAILIKRYAESKDTEGGTAQS